jgi:hypothetical protein
VLIALHSDIVFPREVTRGKRRGADARHRAMRCQRPVRARRPTNSAAGACAAGCPHRLRRGLGHGTAPSKEREGRSPLGSVCTTHRSRAPRRQAPASDARGGLEPPLRKSRLTTSAPRPRRRDPGSDSPRRFPRDQVRR